MPALKINMETLSSTGGSQATVAMQIRPEKLSIACESSHNWLEKQQNVSGPHYRSGRNQRGCHLDSHLFALVAKFGQGQDIELSLIYALYWLAQPVSRPP